MEMARISQSTNECIKEVKEGSPAHYVLTIKSYSLLSKTMEQYTTNDFEAGGFKWKLILYPKGNTSDNVTDHISLYISISDSNNLALGWEMNAVFRFFLFDQINNVYFTMQGRVTRLSAMKPVFGISRFLSLEEISNPSSGYIVDDTCVLGAEVFVAKTAVHGECLMLKNFSSCKHEWKISKFSNLTEITYSDSFSSGNFKWKIKLYPKGDGHGSDHFISLFVMRDASDDSTCQYKVFAEYTLRIIKSPKGCKDAVETGKRWFNDAAWGWGWNQFLSLSSVKDYLADDCLTIEAEIQVLSTVKKMS